MNSRPITKRTLFRASFLLAGIVGGVMRSWPAFFGMLGLGRAVNCHSAAKRTPQ